MKKYRRIINVAMLGLVAASLTACGANNKVENESASSKSTTNTSQTTADTLVGAYQNTQKGMAVKFNANGTGRYVYADPVNSDTNDQLTWTKTGDNEYTLKFDDSDVTSPVTAHLNGNQLTLTGDSNWATDSMTRANGKLDLDKYLADHHGNGSHQSPSSPVDPRRVGAMIYQATYDGMPGREKFNFSDNNGTYSFSEANDDSGAMEYRIKGNTVTYWRASDPSSKQTTSIQSLTSRTDQEQISGIVSNTI